MLRVGGREEDVGGRTRASSAASRVVPARSKSNMIMSHRMSRRVASRRSRRRFFFSAAALILNARVAYFFLGFFAPLKRPSFRSPSYPAPMTPESRTAALRNHSAKDFFSPWWTEGAGAGVEGQRFGLLFVVCCFAPPRKNNTSGAPSGGATRPSGRRCVTGDVDRWLRSSRGDFIRNTRATRARRRARDSVATAPIPRASIAFARARARSRVGRRDTARARRSQWRARREGWAKKTERARVVHGPGVVAHLLASVGLPGRHRLGVANGAGGAGGGGDHGGADEGGHGEHLRACVARVS